MNIINKYPLLFARYYLPMQQTEMCWGLQIGQGWLPIIDELCHNIQALIDNKEIEPLEFDCIKEKYGSLRIRIVPDKNHKVINTLMDVAIRKASITCEDCSAPVVRYYNSSENSEEDNNCNNYNYNILCNNCKASF
jgi:hypothetical protein